MSRGGEGGKIEAPMASDDSPVTGSLKRLKTGALSRGLAVGKMAATLGARAAGSAIGGLLASEDSKADRVKALLLGQVEVLARELGTLKGSLMKVGQMLSMYGEYFFPAEVNAVLKSLQSQSPPLAWAAIEAQLRRQLGEERLAELEVDPRPLAAASLGQVHRARVRATAPSAGERCQELALKVQYPGVDAAIDGDIKALKTLLGLAKLLPVKVDSLFEEVREMLLREVDYARELGLTDEFRARLEGDARFVVPRTFERWSTPRVLATSLETGLDADAPEVLALPQARRDAIGLALIELFLRELVEWRAIQTDAHFGNYKIRLAPAPGEPDRLVLLDFGATRELAPSFAEPYHAMTDAAFRGDRPATEKAARELGFIGADDSEEYRDRFWQVCQLFMEPFAGGVYDWGASDLPRRVAAAGAKLVLSSRLRPPPREIVFVDRKMGGVFVFLNRLGARVDARPLMERFLGGRARG